MGDYIFDVQEPSSLHVLFQLEKMNSNKAVGVDGFRDR